MSGILSDIGSILFTTQRSIAGIIPDLTIREQGMDELEITQHPIETGAAITDHAFARQPTLQLEYGWSTSFLSGFSAQSLLSGQIPDLSFGAQKTRQVYEQLLALQASRVPFSVVTGKRLYTNMLLEGLGVMTDVTSENALQVTATCRGINIVSTQSTTFTPQAQQAIPASTAAVSDVGTVQPAAADNNTILRSIANWVGFKGTL